jgi:hypothetical protein
MNFAAPQTASELSLNENRKLRLPVRWSKITLVLIVSGLGTGLMILAVNVLPTLYGDAHFFMPNTINYAAGRGLINPWYPQADFGHGCRLVGHGYFQSLLYGTLLWSPTYRALYQLTACVAIAVLAAAAALYYVAIPVSGGRLLGVMTAAAGLMVAGLPPFMTLTGRPESLALLIVLLAVIALRFTPERYQWLVLGTCLGLLPITTPAAGVIGAPLAVCYLCWRLPWRRAVLSTAATAVASCLTVVGVSQTWYPYGLSEWIRGVAWHADLVKDASVGNVYLFSLFLNTTTFAWGLWLIGGAVCAGPALWRRRKVVQFPAGVLVCSVVLAAVVLRLTWNLSWRFYYLVPFMPLICAAVLQEAGHWLLAARSRRQRIIVSAVLLAIAAPPTFGTARMFLAASLDRADCLDYATARKIFERLRRQYGSLTITSGLFPLADDQDGVLRIPVDSHTFQRIRNTPAFAQTVPTDILIVQQTKILWQPSLPATQAPQIPGFTLLADHFARRVPTFLGVHVSSTPDAYNFAVYSKQKPGQTTTDVMTRDLHP